MMMMMTTSLPATSYWFTGKLWEMSVKATGTIRIKKLVAGARAIATDDTSGEYLYQIWGAPGDIISSYFESEIEK